MTTYAVISLATGSEAFRYNADHAIEWSGFEYARFDHIIVPDVALDPPPAAPAQDWSGLEFQRRFTVPERLAARAAEVTDPVLADFWGLLRSVVPPERVRSDDADVQVGLGYMVQTGLLSAARRDEILGIA